MSQNIDDILLELYASEPGLRQHDAALRRTVAELVALRPDAVMDESFRAELRRRLMRLAEETQIRKQPLTNIFMRKFQIAGVALVALALVAAGALYLTGNSPARQISSMMSAPQITKAGQNAFGSLINLQADGGRGQGGDGTVNLSETAAPVPTGDMGTGSGGAGDTRLIAPVPVNYRYVYSGEPLTLEMQEVEVLKRIKDSGGASLSDFISRVTLGLIDLSSFSNAKLQNFTFAEDRDRGYMVNVMLNEGSIGIHENWEKWRDLYDAQTCPAQGGDGLTRELSICQPRRIDISEVPADQALIDTANAFLDRYGIPRANYGQPIVNSDWRVFYDAAPNKADYWVPEVMSVTYPLMLNGQPVYDEAGGYSGLMVSVRFTPELAVSSVYDLTTQNYQSSGYAAETDVDRIMGLVEQGGFRNYYYGDENAQTVELEVGSPEMAYVRLWNYANGANEELLVPSLIFPVLTQPEDTDGYWYRRNVVIPLVKEILDNENGNGGVRPLAEPAVDVAEPQPAADIPEIQSGEIKE